MSSWVATASIAFCGSQPPFCSCAFHRSAITAEASRPGGYLPICFRERLVLGREREALG